MGRMGCGAIPSLLGHTIALTGDRRSAELAAHLRSLGADVLHGPVVHTRPVADDDRMLRAATEAVIIDPPAYLLATTGIGIRGWINAAASWRARHALLTALQATHVLARGPKVVGALSEAGLHPWHVALSGRTTAMVEHLLERSIAGAHVAVQLPGDPMDETVAVLERAGARVTTVPVYEWTWPDDIEPARRVVRAIAGARVSAVTFTSRPAVRQLVALAAREGLDHDVSRALRAQVRSICIGPTTAETLRELTGASPRCPARSMLGEMAPVVADHVREGGHHHLRLPGGEDVVVQGRLIDAAGMAVMTSEREAAVLNLLLGPSIRTVSRAEILQSVWRADASDASVLDSTMARLRRRVRGTGRTVKTVAGRGYLLNGERQPCPADAGRSGLLGAVDVPADGGVRALVLPST